MNRLEALNVLGDMPVGNFNKKEVEALKLAIKGLQELGYIDTIIHQTDGIQEDVISYQMICKVMESEERE